MDEERIKNTSDHFKSINTIIKKGGHMVYGDTDTFDAKLEERSNQSYRTK